MGLQMMTINFLLYSALGIFLDIIMNSAQIGSKRRSNHDAESALFCSRVVTFESSDEGIIEIKGLKERGNNMVSYNLTVEKSKICCLIGNDSD